MRNYISSGETLTLPAPDGGAESGVPFKIGGLLAVPKANAPAGVRVACQMAGHMTLPKATGSAWDHGTPLFWNNSAKKVTTSDTGNIFVGYATAPAASGDTEGELLKINAPYTEPA